MDEAKPTVLIVEDSYATRMRLNKAITKGRSFQLLESVGDFKSASEILKNNSPDILLTDLDLPDGNGIDLIKMLHLPEVKTQLAIVISIFGDGDHVINALKAGASGYLLKDDNFIDINNAITQMLQGGSPISPSIARHLLDELTLLPSYPITGEVNNYLLTKREKEVLILVSKGYTDKEIGDAFNLSIHTIKGYVKNIYKKLSVRNRMQAVHEAKLQGIL
ncbi:MAG: response regulator transcription factor [Cellvibrionaceae bacterium]